MPNQIIDSFFASESFGVIGASNDRSKYGNKVLRAFIQMRKKVIPVHPKEELIEGLNVVHDVLYLPNTVKSISIITPPNITEDIIEKAHRIGIQFIWMQPGAESPKAIADCKKYGINLIAQGPCILVKLGFQEKYI